MICVPKRFYGTLRLCERPHPTCPRNTYNPPRGGLNRDDQQIPLLPATIQIRSPQEYTRPTKNWQNDRPILEAALDHRNQEPNKFVLRIVQRLSTIHQNLHGICSPTYKTVEERISSDLHTLWAAKEIIQRAHVAHFYSHYFSFSDLNLPYWMVYKLVLTESEVPSSQLTQMEDGN